MCLGSPYVFGEQYHRPPLGGIQGEWATAIHPAGPSRVKHASETNAPAHGLGMLAGRGPLYRILLQRSSTGVCRALGACISGGVLRSVRFVDLALLTLCAWMVGREVSCELQGHWLVHAVCSGILIPQGLRGAPELAQNPLILAVETPFHCPVWVLTHLGALIACNCGPWFKDCSCTCRPARCTHVCALGHGGPTAEQTGCMQRLEVPS